MDKSLQQLVAVLACALQFLVGRRSRGHSVYEELPAYLRAVHQRAQPHHHFLVAGIKKVACPVILRIYDEGLFEVGIPDRGGHVLVLRVGEEGYFDADVRVEVDRNHLDGEEEVHLLLLLLKRRGQQIRDGLQSRCGA